MYWILLAHTNVLTMELVNIWPCQSFGAYFKNLQGHELAFMMFLYSLKEIGFYKKEDYESVVRNVFYRYNVINENIS